jgi:hypothetical protein
MTEEKACHYAKALAQGMGITFYVVRSRAGLFLPVQKPSDDCEILATIMRGRAPSSLRSRRPRAQSAMRRLHGALQT